MLLSIGMIVKNEEKYLGDCLKALNSLRKNVDCELIIADTGSTDNTRNIAVEYADIFFDFEWCNDFAAARNSTLDRASGKWYMFLDADEIFESTTDIEHFFNSGEYKEYHSASFRIHSYTDAEHLKYIDTSGSRLFDLSMPQARFVHPIHEGIPLHGPTKICLDFVHHYGYIHDGGEREKAKHQRNLNLLYKALEKNPEDIRTLSHLSREFNPIGKDAEQVLKYCDTGINVLQKRLRLEIAKGKIPPKNKMSEYSNYFFMFYHQKAIVYRNEQQWTELKNICEEYFDNSAKVYMCHIDMYFLYGDACFSLKMYEQARKAYQEYFELQDAYIHHTLKTDDELYAYIQLADESHKTMAKVQTTRCLIKLEQFETALKHLFELSLSNVDYIPQTLDCMDKLGKYEDIHTLWDAFQKEENEIKQKCFLDKVEQFVLSNPEKRDAIIQALASYEGGDSSNYILLNQIRIAYDNADIDFVQDKLLVLFSVPQFPHFLADSIYYAMIINTDLSALFDSVLVDDLSAYIQSIKTGHKDFSKVIFDYFQQRDYRNTEKGVYWQLMLQESAILENNLSNEIMLILIPNYLECIILYINLLYNQALLSEEKISILPAYARFAYYVEQAFDADKKGDELGYYRNMTLAIDQYKVMAKSIKLLINHHKEEQANKKKQLLQDNKELMELAAQVKKQLYSFVEQNNYSAAKEVLSSYDKIIPNDPALSCIREIIQSDGSLSLSTIPS